MNELSTTSHVIPSLEDRSLVGFVSGMTEAIASSTDGKNLTHRIRLLLTEALKSETFTLDCVEQAITAMASNPLAWNNPPIVNDEEREFSIRLVYWPPHFSNSPHEHTFWTVTGVFYNELNFATYLRHSNDDGVELEIERNIRGRRGEVGYILPPCIHSVSNTSDSLSISIHIFSGPKLAANSYERGRTTWYHPDDDDDHLTRLFTVSSTLKALLAVLDSIDHPRSLVLMDRMFPLADQQTRLACAKAIGKRDPVRAGHRLLELAKQCRPHDAARLESLANSLINTSAGG